MGCIVYKTLKVLGDIRAVGVLILPSKWRTNLSVPLTADATDMYKKHDYVHNNVCVLLYGQHSAGKTSVLYRIKLGMFIVAAPTMCVLSDTASVKFEGSSICVHDLAFLEPSTSANVANKFVPWHMYHKHTDAVIYVIDSMDRRGLDDVRDELLNLMHEEHYVVHRSKFLILCNKQDKKMAMSVNEIRENLSLPNSLSDIYHIQGCSALSGEGILDGLRWLVDPVVNKKDLRSMAAACVQVVMKSANNDAIKPDTALCENQIELVTLHDDLC